MLDPVCSAKELAGTSYSDKVKLIYGYDGAFQFKAIPHITTIINKWATQMARNKLSIVIPTTPIELVAIRHFKLRLEVGSTFLLPSRLVDLARSPKADNSMLTYG